MASTELTETQIKLLDRLDPSPASVPELLDEWPGAPTARAAAELRSMLSAALVRSASRTGTHIGLADGLPPGVKLDAIEAGGGDLLCKILADIGAIGRVHAGRAHRGDAAMLAGMLGRLAEAERSEALGRDANLGATQRVLTAVNRAHASVSTRWVLRPAPPTTQFVGKPQLWWSPADHRAWPGAEPAVWVALEVRMPGGTGLSELLGTPAQVVLVCEPGGEWSSMCPGPRSLASLLATLTEQCHVVLGEIAPWVDRTPHGLDDDEVEEDRRHG